MARYCFNGRVQHEVENISTLVATLQSLSEYCNIGNTLETVIMKQLMRGVCDVGKQKRLFAGSSLTLEKALRIALAVEVVTKDAVDLKEQSKDRESQVNTVKPKLHGQGYERKKAPLKEGRQARQKPQKSMCTHCSSGEHRTTCLFHEADCYKCGKKGHLARACRSS